MMQLSATQFEQIVSSLKSDGGNRQKERRRGPRVGVRNSVLIVPVIDGKARTPVQVALRDISREGIGLLSESMMKAGSQFIAQFPKSPDEEETVLVCTVKNCRQLNEMFAIGACFMKAVRKPRVNEKVAELEAPEPAIRQLVAKSSGSDDLERIQRAILD